MNDALAVGITAVPNPYADMDWDGWLYHRFCDIHAHDAMEVGGDPAEFGQTVVQFEVDSKAMRKVDIGESVFAAVHVIERGNATMDVWFDSRTLFYLP